LLGTTAARLVVATSHHAIRPTEIMITTAGRVIAKGPSFHKG